MVSYIYGLLYIWSLKLRKKNIRFYTLIKEKC